LSPDQPIQTFEFKIYESLKYEWHIRLLVTHPAAVRVETFIDPRFGLFVHGIVRSQVVPATERSALEWEITDYSPLVSDHARQRLDRVSLRI